MNSEEKTRDQLLVDLAELRQRMVGEGEFATRLDSQAGAIIQSEERYRRLAELSPDMILLHSEGRYTYANPAAVRILGARGPEDLAGKPVLEIIHPDFREIEKDRLVQLEEGREIFPLEERYRRLDGTAVDLEVAAAPLFYQGQPMILVVARDITERKRMDAKLRESEERYRPIFETTGAGTMIIEDDMTVSLVNNAFERLSGYSKEEIEGKKRWTEFVLEEDLERVKEYHRLRRINPDRVPRSYENRFLTKSGEVLNTLFTVGMIPGTKKSVASFLDVTQGKQAEKAVRQLANEKAIMAEISRIIGSTLKTEEVYERFAQEAKKLIPFDRIAVNIIHAKDRTFTHAYVSGFDVPERRGGEVVPLAGSGTEEVMRTGSTLIVQEPNLENAIRQFPGLLPAYRAGLRSLVLVPLISQDQVIGILNLGSTQSNVYTEADIKLAENIGAQIAGAIANAELFAAIRRGEEALRASEEKYRTLVENATEAIFIIQDEKIKFPNYKAISLSGYSAEELSKISFTGLIHPDDREAVLDRYKRRIQGQEIPSIQTYRVLTKAGEELWGQFNSVPITWEGRPATLNIGRDMTREKKLEVQFQTAQKMEAIGTLAGGIAHDFNNLLMGIQGHVSLMLFDLDPSHPHFESLKKIEAQVKNGASLSGQLLAFARRGKYEVKPTDVNKIIQQTSSMFERTKREINIHRKYQEGIWAIEVDRGQIEQVLMNLYVNGWQAMPEGGNLFLESRNVTLDRDIIKAFSAEPGRYVRISVRDTGTGMDQNTRQRIFDPFFTTKEMGRGTGLGLASVYGIIKNHGGFIDVYSEIGEGTTFNIYLPASDKKASEDKRLSGEILRGKEMVLLVDDEQTITEIMEKALTLTGYRVLLARGGEEAIEVYKKNQNRIDLVVLDMIMPGMNGGKVFDRLREMNPGVKVILSSGYSLDGEASQIMERGCSGFIQKPFGIKELSQKIREVLNTF